MPPSGSNNAINARRVARRLVLSVLYEIDTTTHEPEGVLDARIKATPIKEDAAAFVRGMVLGIVRETPTLDSIIGEVAPEFPVETLSVIDRNILRIAIFELAFNRQLSVKVAINEAVELGKVYGSDNTPAFVNGALGTVVKIYDDLPDLFEETD